RMQDYCSARLFLLFLVIAAAGLPANCGELEYTFHQNVMIPMRDGVKLAANLFIPNEEKAFPVILMRTPYGKSDENFGLGKEYASYGYAVVVQDCRGKGDSEGVWDPFRYDVEDGYDTQQWVGVQPWCDGNIGTSGGSYVGWTQWASAPEGSPYLRTMIPIVPFAHAYQVMYAGGAYQLSLSMGWGAMVSGAPIDGGSIQWDEAFSKIPLNQWDEQFGHEIFYLRDWVKHSTYDDYWKKRGIDGQFDKITVPILNIGGWYDIFSKATLEQIARVRSESKNFEVRRNQFCILGPWGHGANQTKVGELDFGDTAKIEWGKIQRQWYDYWLKGKNTGVEDWPAFYLFIMGENQWRGENEWPLARTVFTNYYLHSDGSANTRNGSGSLNIDLPETGETPDTYVYDPENPVPTHGGNNLVGSTIGPYDQQKIEDRNDVLVYTSEALEKAVEVTGPVKLMLYAASTAQDTDFTGKLVDVHPDGRAYNVCEGIIRARYRDSCTDLSLIEPGKVYRYEIDLWVTSNLFKAGHRIRLEVSSSNFPRFDRNPNSGKEFGTDEELFKATQTIFHDKNYPSHLVLPIIPR
ncbi:MAG: CocE/NonD family hydrolase, partial [Candidatus Hinthialibacter sp.]